MQAEIVAMDEKEGESGLRATLNLGHTFGHAVETGMGYGSWLHGEAVSLGMAMAADLSVRLGWIDSSIRDRTVALLQRAKLPVSLPADSKMTPEKFESIMSVDKKVSNGVLKLILLKGELGRCVFTADYESGKLLDTIQHFCNQ
jgi:3-dehydroquinate synthase